MKVYFKQALFVVLKIYLLMMLVLFVAQRELIFKPDITHFTPQDMQLSKIASIKTITTDDGLTLEGWYFEGIHKDAPLIVLFHGNVGNINDRINIATDLRNAGSAVLIPLYRGYSGNPGKPSMKALYADARKWVQLAKADFPEKPLIIYGRSLGSGIASKMAGEFEARALILEVPYTRIADVAQKRYPIFPVSFLLLDRFDNIKNLKDVEEPVLVLGASDDKIIPVENAEKVFAAVQGYKVLKIYDGAGHSDLYTHKAFLRIREFISEVL